jgi:hypothetical protein
MYTESVQTGGNWVDPHKKMGLALLILICLQLVGGIFIHFVKIPFMGGHRPPQNYLHAILGLTIIACAFWQAWYGIMFEWTEGTGGVVPVPHSAWVGWIAWAVVSHIPFFFVIASNNFSDYASLQGVLGTILCRSCPLTTSIRDGT